MIFLRCEKIGKENILIFGDFNVFQIIIGLTFGKEIIKY